MTRSNVDRENNHKPPLGMEGWVYYHNADIEYLLDRAIWTKSIPLSHVIIPSWTYFLNGTVSNLQEKS